MTTILAPRSFRAFMADGYQGHEATVGDFELHLSTLFPEVRLKRYIEVRSADGGPRDAVLALPALWKGLLYDAEARRDARALFDPLDVAAHRALYQTAFTDGIHGDSAFGPLIELIEEILRLSTAGLDRLAAAEGHQSEAIFLQPMRERVEARRSYSDLLLQDYEETGGDLAALADRWKL